MKLLDTGKNNVIDIHPSVDTSSITMIIKGDNNVIKIGAGSIIKDFCFNLSHGSNHIVTIGTEVVLHGGTVVFEYDNNALAIGSQCNIYSGFICNVLEPKVQIIIMNNCLFSHSVTMRTGDSHCIYDVTTNKRLNEPKSIMVSSHVWVCENVRILKGACICSNSVVGIGSIVTGKVFPANSLIAGIPARVVKTNINWRPETE